MHAKNYTVQRKHTSREKAYKNVLKASKAELFYRRNLNRVLFMPISFRLFSLPPATHVYFPQPWLDIAHVHRHLHPE